MIKIGSYFKMQKGFSLVEMLVTISIIAILMIVSLPAFGKYGQKQTLNQGAEEVGSVIRQTQNLALAPDDEKPEGTDSYAFVCGDDKLTYNISYYNNDAKKVIINYKDYNLPENVSFQSCTNIVFENLFGKITSPAAPVDLILKSSKIDDTKTVKINTITGQVEIE